MNSLFRLAILLFTLSTSWALDLSKLVPQGYVSDYANVIPRPQRLAIERYASAIEKQTGAQLAIVTIPSLDGEPIEDVANSLYRQWGIGKKGQDEGLLLLLSVNDRRSRLEVGYGLEPILPDGAAGDVLRQMRPALRVSAYGDALTTATRYLGSRIAQAKGVSLKQETPQPSRQRPEERAIPGWMLLAGGALFLYLLATGNGSALWLLSALFSGGRGGYHHRGGSGGGFGGYDSGGGGFGGFGGGDSGGGGASSDW